MKEIEIEVDCNNDKLILREDSRVIIEIEVKHPSEFIGFFSELFNRIEHGEINSVYTNIKLTKTDEDRSVTIEEW